MVGGGHFGGLHLPQGDGNAPPGELPRGLRARQARADYDDWFHGFLLVWDSADEVGAQRLLPLRQAVFLPAQGDALDQEGHIPGQGAHGLEALGVLGASPGRRPWMLFQYWLEATGMPLMVKNLFSSVERWRTGRPAAAATAAPTFMVLSKGVE